MGLKSAHIFWLKIVKFMKELPKAYEPQKYEDQIYQKWLDSGFFNPDVCVKNNVCKDDSPYFSIVLPPPNVTGTLHIGHAMMLAIQDLMVRYHRMKGDRTLWLPGTDHAAIATQTKVEKLLMEKGVLDPKKELGRDKFLKEVEKFAQESHDTIVNQCKKMGSSLDWSREAYTLDEPRNLAVRTVFKKMYDDGLIYRGYRLVNWCPRCHSTLADDEVEYKSSRTKLYWIKYGPFVLATTRPETKLGDTAVAVNPKDKRYKDMVGKKYMIPGVLGEFEIEVVADDTVDMDFGSGAVKVTPYHSFADYEIAARHKIPGKQIIDEDGKMMANCGKYAGMTTAEARKAIVTDMEKMGLIDHVDENYENNLSVCYRCGTAIEPIPSKQWFIDVNKEFVLENSKIKDIKSGTKVSLKKLMRQVVENGQVDIIPDRFKKTYFHWIDNLHDWCISRQIWFGHRIPVYYCKQNCHPSPSADGEGSTLIVSVDEIIKCPYCGGEVSQDPDTLDTWFSSGLWTFSTLGWPNKTLDFSNFHPTTLMETGYDILFFWVARMILMTTYVLGDIPFEKVYLHGLVRDEQGRKMSKSLGNVINPLDTISKYGADATRLSLVLGNTPGNDVKLSEEKIAGFRNFTNKLWNISRFMLLNIPEPKFDIKKPKAKTLADEWILGNLDGVINMVTMSLEKYQLSGAGDLLRTFTWDQLADWYLEIAKIESASPADKDSKTEILNYILNTILKLWHPFMPFVTEEIWSEIYGADKMLMIETWPWSLPLAKGESEWVLDSEKVLNDFNLIRDVITSIRSLRADNKIEPVKKVSVLISAGKTAKLLEDNRAIIETLARLETLTIAPVIEKPKTAAGVVLGEVEIFVDLAGLVDLAKEKERLQKELAELTPYITGLEKKLSNEEFVKNAPPAVVDKERAKLSEAQEKMEKIKNQLFI